MYDDTNTNGKSLRVSSAGKQHAFGITSNFESRMLAAGLVNVQAIDRNLVVELKYASPHNFMGANVYGELKDCYLQKDAALKLKRANDLLQQRDPKLRLLVADGCRPRSIQQRMWQLVKGTPMQKYVANPAVGSMHNYGAAVDVTIIAENGNRLDMGTPMDHFGILSQPRKEAKFLRAGKLTADHIAARRLLREVMTRAGFQSLSIEWWHFNACDRPTAKAKYQIIE